MEPPSVGTGLELDRLEGLERLGIVGARRERRMFFVDRHRAFGRENSMRGLFWIIAGYLQTILEGYGRPVANFFLLSNSYHLSSGQLVLSNSAIVNADTIKGKQKGEATAWYLEQRKKAEAPVEAKH